MDDLLQDLAPDWDCKATPFTIPFAGSAQVVLPANPNRWSFTLAIAAAGTWTASPVPVSAGTPMIPVSVNPPYTLFTFDDWGGVVFYPWIVQGAPGAVFNLIESIYLPVRGAYNVYGRLQNGQGV